MFTEHNLNLKERYIQPSAGTDINAAVLESVKMIKKYHKEGSASMLILLTDGDPTSGLNTYPPPDMYDN